MDYLEEAKKFGGSPLASNDTKINFLEEAKKFGGQPVAAPKVDYLSAAKEFGGAPISQPTKFESKVEELKEEAAKKPEEKKPEGKKKESNWYDFLVENEKAKYDLSKMVGEDVAVAAKNAPVQSAAALAAAIEGNDPNVIFGNKDWKDSVINQARKQSKESRDIEGGDSEYLLGIKRSTLRNLPQNLSYSLVSMGSGLAAGIPAFFAGSAATPVVGAVAGYSSGAAASGFTAYRMDTNGFLRDLREHLDEGSIKVTGKPLTDKQFITIAPKYESLVREHGLWEALPEALSNVLGAKIGGAIFKEAALGIKGLVGTSTKVGAQFLNELGTETITQTGQHNVEVEAGLSNDRKRSFTSYEDLKKSAEEVLPDVLLLSGVVAGGARVAGGAKRIYDENTDAGRAGLLSKALEQDISERNFTRSGIKKEVLENLQYGQTPEDVAAREQDIGLPIERPVTPDVERTAALPTGAPKVAPPEPPLEEKPAAQVEAETQVVAPTVITEQNFTDMGIGKTNKKLRQELIGKDLADETQREEVKTALEKFASNPKLTPTIKDKVEGFLSSPEMRGEFPAQAAPAAEITAPVFEQSLPQVQAGSQVDGLTVREQVPNTNSIAASLENYDVLPGVRAVPISDLGEPGPKTNNLDALDKRTRQLADEISESGEINPLIVVYSGDGNYILEGSHRIDALDALGKKEIPAVVVIDKDNPPSNYRSPTEEENVDFYNEESDARYPNIVNTSEPASVQQENKRMPSLKREVQRINKAFNNGEITAEQHAEQTKQALDLNNSLLANKPVNPRSRGADFIRQKILEAKRRGDISEESADFTEWFIMQNPALVSDLGISVRQPRNEESGIAGGYNPASRIFILLKNAATDTTAVHEILHHMERMMPTNVQNSIRAAWKKNLDRAAKKADKGKDDNLKMFFDLLNNYHFGGVGLSSDLQMRAALKMINEGKVPYEFYQFANPSEFWAVNATDIVANRYNFSDTVMNRLKNWLREFAETIKGIFGLTSKAPIIKALDSLMRSDGKFKSSEMLGEADAYNAPKKPQNVSPEAQSALDELEQNGMGASPVQPGMAERFRKTWDNAVQNPKATVESARQKFRDFRDFIETRAFSSDAAINNNIRRAITDMGLDSQEVTGALLEISLSQTFHSDAIANNLLMYGKVTYNNELHKWEATQVKDNFVSLARQLDEFAKTHNMTNEQAQLIAHRAFEARRTFGLMRFTEEIDAEVKSLFNRANRLAQEAKDERDAGNEERAAQLEKDSASKAKEARAFAKNRKTIHLTPEQIQLGMDMFTRFPELNNLVDTWNEMRKNAKDMMLEGGLWSEEDAELMLSNMDYVPFYREDELDTNSNPRAVLKGLQVQQEKKLTGSMRPVNNIFDNMARWMQYAANRSVRNRSALALVDTATEVNLAEKVSDTKGNPNTIKVWRDGKEEIYSLQDPMFVEAFKGMETIAIPLVKMFAKFSNTLRNSVVMMPLFTITQVPQDAYAAMFTSGLKPQYAFRIPVLAIKEFTKTLFKMSKTHEELRKFGVVGVKDFSASVARLDAEVAAGLKAPPGVLGKVKSALQHFAMAGDNAIRQATYEASMQAGKTQAESLEKAFDLINFRRRGSSRTLAIAGQVIPFFSAYQAAQNVAYKVITGRGISPSDRAEALKTFAAMNASVMALSVIYAMLNGDDEDYLKKPATVRDRLLMIPGTGGLSIPLRKDLFTLPKVLAEHTYLLLTDKGYEDPRKFRDSVKSLLQNALLSPTVVPQAIKPLVEVSFNRDFFQDTPLIPQSMLNLDTERQFNNSTSELGKLAGKTGMVAPVNFDHLVRGMFGSFGGLTLYATNFMLHSDPNVSRPEMSFKEVMRNLPGTSGFVSRPYENALRSDFYVLREEVTKSANTLRDIEKRSPHKIKEVLKDKEFLRRADLEKDVNKIAKELTGIRNEITMITNAPDTIFNPQEKAEMINKLRTAEEKMLKSINVKKLRKMANL
jgi:hypothetical protein